MMVDDITTWAAQNSTVEAPSATAYAELGVSVPVEGVFKLSAA